MPALTKNTSNSPIQIRMYKNKPKIIDAGILPDGWTVDTLFSSHGRQPYTPNIANMFFRAGEIEAWERGIECIRMMASPYLNSAMMLLVYGHF